MYVIQKGGSHPTFMGYDELGEPKWFPNILDATRIDTRHDALRVIRRLGSALLTAKHVGLHGYYLTYRDHLVQIYKEGYRQWRVRVVYGEDILVGKRHAETPKAALRYGMELANQMIETASSCV